ncbi:lysophospholipid acyltransferase family protein [Marinicella litoralis]|uniref:KDO2-lipid IV(A) lauroyltransferase n=1 Tax=Marinicella litoralis TaxID=644220 RepID=A0A4R6XN77_9GAMM|nr:lysophospholipid acyltransferase family protein [Marinicella litoralis]TDR19590.1 KDO2-lipid IV(A) lauroyltransferase [Marinicella litoralis]
MSYSKKKTDFQVRLAQWLARRKLSNQMRIGRMIGRLFNWIPNSRKSIARTNIKICFPELNPKQAKRLLKQNLVSTGQGIVEMMAALWAGQDQVEGKFEIDGLEHLHEAMQDGQGCLLLSCHTTSIEWGIRGLNQQLKELQIPVGHMLARQHNNKLLEAHLETARLSFVEKLIDKKNIRGLLSSIKSGHPVYYAPDQNFSYQVTFTDFFGRPAATTVGTHKLAQKGVKVIPWFCFRTGPCEWRIEIHPELSQLGMQEEAAASAQINRLFEQQIKRHPEQYLWVHRRFKNQPEGFENPYQ